MLCERRIDANGSLTQAEDIQGTLNPLINSDGTVPPTAALTASYLMPYLPNDPQGGYVGASNAVLPYLPTN